MTSPRWQPTDRVEPFANPAAGAEISIVPRNCAGWLIHGLRFLFATDATVATRVPTLLLTNGSTRFGGMVPANGQGASATNAYMASKGNSRASLGGSHISMDWPVDGLWLPQGHTLQTFTDNLAAGDQFSAIGLFLTEFPTGTPLRVLPSAGFYPSETE